MRARSLILVVMLAVLFSACGPSGPTVTPIDKPVNCRFGPGKEYAVLSTLTSGKNALILGKNSDGSWWKIRNSDGKSTVCWVLGSVTTTVGKLDGVSTVATPRTFATGVTIMNPETISIPGCIGTIPPVTFSGTIDVNGPTNLTWHFETELGGALPAHTLTTSSSGSNTVSDNSYTPPANTGSYWLKLVVTSPNRMTAQTNYTISCP